MEQVDIIKLKRKFVTTPLYERDYILPHRETMRFSEEAFDVMAENLLTLETYRMGRHIDIDQRDSWWRK